MKRLGNLPTEHLGTLVVGLWPSVLPGSGSDTLAIQNDTYLAYFPLEPNGLLTGIYLGYNQHLDNGIVLSAEADVTISNLSSGEAWLYYPDGTPYPLRNTVTSRLEWSGALRARVGYAFGRFLPYAAAGVAAGKYEVIPDYFDTPPAARRQDIRRLDCWSGC